MCACLHDIDWHLKLSKKYSIETLQSQIDLLVTQQQTAAQQRLLHLGCDVNWPALLAKKIPILND